MKLTVTSKIGGAFALLVLLIVAIAGLSFTGISNIGQSLNVVAENNIPMVLSGGKMTEALLESGLILNKYDNEKKIDQLEPIYEDFNKVKVKYSNAHSKLLMLTSGYEEISKNLKLSREQVEQLFKSSEQFFNLHEKELASANQVKKGRTVLEDSADELDSLLYDLSDEISTDDEALGQSLIEVNDIIQDATVAVTDSFAYTKLNVIQTSLKEVEGLSAEIDIKMNELLNNTLVQSSSATQEISSMYAQFINQAKGQDSVVKHYLEEKTYAQESTELLEKIGLGREAAVQDVSSVIHKVNTITVDMKDSAQQTVTTNKSLIVLFAIVAVVVAVLVSFAVIQSIRKPLYGVVGALEQVATGDLKASLEVKGHDELSRLADSTNQLVGKLRTMIAEITSNADDLLASSSETTNISNTSNENIILQGSKINEAVSLVSEISFSIEEVAQGAQSTAEEVKKAYQQTESGQSIVEESVSSINQLASNIQQASEVINQLNKQSTDIGSVLDVIQGIAEQTNLLALNAAIEAARAGEQGRGFAVVADEVRTLAIRTQESTTEINKMIEQLQIGAKEAVKAMTISSELAQSSVKSVNSSGSTLTEINQAVGVINEMSTQIFSFAESQSEVSGRLSKFIRQIHALAEETADGATASLAASQKVSGLAENLKTQVGFFKI
ncbi:MAG: methyl-accepting chemotaxis protein [bacterium]